ncbi:hypothetical protein E2C01_085036 [Portunus trituberculatus]|uniref:Uncharacterized protein n=1 Tax=Portunus trituberculatus TaxID=210409 RepID=A0A5B7J5P8_PORTR|nr:hypothetical protein [Portunus trituberculatus]
MAAAAVLMVAVDAPRQNTSAGELRERGALKTRRQSAVIEGDSIGETLDRYTDTQRDRRTNTSKQPRRVKI